MRTSSQTVLAKPMLIITRKVVQEHRLQVLMNAVHYVLNNQAVHIGLIGRALAILKKRMQAEQTVMVEPVDSA